MRKIPEHKHERIIKAAEYFYGLKPSDFCVVGTIDPARWRHFMAFCELILEEDKPPANENQLTDEEIMDVLNTPHEDDYL